MQQLDFRAISHLLLSKWKWIVIAVVIGALIGGGIATFLMPEKYTTHVKMYVSNITQAADKQSSNDASYGNLTAAERLALTYVDILENRATLERVIPKLSRSLSVQELADMISFKNIPQTALMYITVTADSPQFAAEVCNAMAEVAPEVLSSVVGAGSVKVIGRAGNGGKTSPNVTRAVMIGAVAGLALTVVFLVARQMLDTTVKTASELKERLQVPVLGVVPEFERAAGKKKRKGVTRHGKA